MKEHTGAEEVPDQVLLATLRIQQVVLDVDIVCFDSSSSTRRVSARPDNVEVRADSFFPEDKLGVVRRI